MVLPSQSEHCPSRAGSRRHYQTESGRCYYCGERVRHERRATAPVEPHADLIGVFTAKQCGDLEFLKYLWTEGLAD